MTDPIDLIVLGDCCADLYPQTNTTLLGGTAYNVAVAARQAGASVGLVSAVGADAIGESFWQACQTQQINTEQLLIVPDRITSQLQVDLDANGKPTYSEWKLEALEVLNTTPLNQQYLQRGRIIHSVLYQPLAPLFDQYARLDLPDALKVGDFSGESLYFTSDSVLHRYAPRLDILVRSADPSDQATLNFLQEIAATYHKLVLVLLGAAGSQVYFEGQVFHQPTARIKTVNTTGAGDTFIAHFAYAYLLTRDIPTALARGTAGAVARLQAQSF